MTCYFCKNEDIQETIADCLIQIDDTVYLIKDVPCFKCDICGEKYYSDEVQSNLENIISLNINSNEEFVKLKYKAPQTA